MAISFTNEYLEELLGFMTEMEELLMDPRPKKS